MFKKRIGPDPHANGRQTSGAAGCPDIWELEDGNFAIIGAKAEHLKKSLPATAGVGWDENIIIIPRETLLLAKNDIPEK